MVVCIQVLEKKWKYHIKSIELITLIIETPPKMYIIKKLLSTASPDINRDIENIGTLLEKTVIPFPNKAIIFEKISTGRRPIVSANEPKICVPTTEPTKNID